MNRHPAHQLAMTVMTAAEELRGYMDSSDPFPWELTEDDRRALLPCLERAITALGDGIRDSAQATGDEYAKQRLTDSYHRLVQASANVRPVTLSFDDGLGDEPGEEPENAAQQNASDPLPRAVSAAQGPEPTVTDSTTFPHPAALATGGKPGRVATGTAPANQQTPGKGR